MSSTASTKPKKRRVMLTSVDPPPAEPPAQVALQPSLSLGGGVEAALRLPPAAEEVINSAEQLGRLLKRETERAVATEQRWVRSPRAPWVQALLAELGAEARQELLLKQRKMQALAETDFLTRWELSADFASKTIDLWFEGRSLQQVLDKSDAQRHQELPSGIVLSGRFVREMAAGQAVALEQLLPWVEKLSPPPAATASLYRAKAENAFHNEKQTETPVAELGAELRRRLISGDGGVGSLNTTFEYTGADAETTGDVAVAPSAEGSASGVELLDNFQAKLDETLYGLDADQLVRLNPRHYLIWKLQKYCTPHHQDVHVPPHFTLYNQVSGVSSFHFLPLLVGLFVGHVGRERGPEKLASLLVELEARKIGHVSTIGPHQMMLILPAGAHGVFVPSVAANPTLQPFEISVIRAAELYLWPLYLSHERQLMAIVTQAPQAASAAASNTSDARAAVMAPTAPWHAILELTEEEKRREAELSAQFAAAQNRLCAELGLTRDEWFRLAQQLCQTWESEKEDRK